MVFSEPVQVSVFLNLHLIALLTQLSVLVIYLKKPSKLSVVGMFLVNVLSCVQFTLSEIVYHINFALFVFFGLTLNPTNSYQRFLVHSIVYMRSYAEKLLYLTSILLALDRIVLLRNPLWYLSTKLSKKLALFCISWCLTCIVGVLAAEYINCIVLDRYAMVTFELNWYLNHVFNGLLVLELFLHVTFYILYKRSSHQELLNLKQKRTIQVSCLSFVSKPQRLH
ncbi:hypothetical protein L596_008743 [Steinernema carpocapsae]|uniref:G-protein coupled receptors family 1 profile domain-containing protein n=1 Tax=Steinernema carpocapsae TaxID=34508 RepID=A0A4U5PDE8_STECR|nr:hypothetical protein L596_008743 [Steinernema carpocapsae]